MMVSRPAAGVLCHQSGLPASADWDGRIQLLDPFGEIIIQSMSGHAHDCLSCLRLVRCRQSDKAHNDAEALKKRTAEDSQQYDQLTSALKDVEAQYRQAGEPCMVQQYSSTIQCMLLSEESWLLCKSATLVILLHISCHVD